MITFARLSFGLLATAVAQALAAPALSSSSSSALNKRQQVITSNKWGIGNDGYFYYFLSDWIGNVTFTNEANGEYLVTWGGGVGDFQVGKGWSAGATTRNIKFSGTFDTDSYGFFGVYGVVGTEATYALYYILEAGNYDPGPDKTYKQTISSDGGEYDIYTLENDNQQGKFLKYWSIRQTERTSGTVTIANHFNVWTSLGISNVNLHYQIMCIRVTQQSTGKADITVSEA